MTLNFNYKGLIGEVQTNPISNTILGRLKDLLTGIILGSGTNIIGKVGIDQTTPGVTNGVSVVGSLAKQFEQLTIDGTVGGIALTSAKYGTNTKAFITIETAPIRVRLDGTAPTATVGHLLNAGDSLELDTASNIANFKAIRTTAVSAIIDCTYSS